MWILLSLIAATGTAGREAVIKRAMRAADEFALMGALTAGTALLLIPLSLLLGVPALGRQFWLALLVSGLLNAAGAVLTARAVHRSDLSLVVPLQSFTPLFMLLTGPILLGEVAGPLGIAGVLLIVAGSYLLKLPSRAAGAMTPFTALLADPGARSMLAVAFLYSISANVDKIGVLHSSPVFWAGTLHGAVAVLLVPLALARLRRSAVQDPRARVGGRLLPWAIVLNCGIAVAQMTAITLTLATYVIAIKRTSIVMGVVVGHAVFAEPGLRHRLPAALIMLAGFLLVTLDG